MLPPLSTPRSKMGAFLMPSRGIDRYATTWLGPALVALVPGRNFGCWCGGDRGSARAGTAWLATGGESKRTRPLAGRAVAIRASPAAISKPAIRFRRIPSIIVRGVRKAVKKQAGRHPDAMARNVPDERLNGWAPGPSPAPCGRTVGLGGLADRRPRVALANGLGERPARLLRRRPCLQHDRLAGERIGAFPCLASLDLAPGEGADLREAHPHTSGAGRNRRLEGVLDRPVELRLLDLQALLSQVFVYQADERRRGPFLRFRHRFLHQVIRWAAALSSDANGPDLKNVRYSREIARKLPVMPQLRFEARLESDQEAHFIRVPAAVVTALGQGKRAPVRVTVNGHTFRGRIAVYGGQYYLGLRREIREAAGAAEGDQLLVVIEFDAELRTVDLPDAL